MYFVMYFVLKSLFFSCMQPLKDSKFVIPKSRYDTIDCYLASAEYNDKEVPYDQEVYQQLLDGGVGDFLSFSKPVFFLFVLRCG